MAISTECPSCGKDFSLPDALANKRIKCKSCNNAFKVIPADVSSSVMAGAPAGEAAVSTDTTSLDKVSFSGELSSTSTDGHVGDDTFADEDIDPIDDLAEVEESENVVDEIPDDVDISAELSADDVPADRFGDHPEDALLEEDTALDAEPVSPQGTEDNLFEDEDTAHDLAPVEDVQQSHEEDMEYTDVNLEDTNVEGDVIEEGELLVDDDLLDDEIIDDGLTLGEEDALVADVGDETSLEEEPIEEDDGVIHDDVVYDGQGDDFADDVSYDLSEDDVPEAALSADDLGDDIADDVDYDLSEEDMPEATLGTDDLGDDTVEDEILEALPEDELVDEFGDEDVVEDFADDDIIEDAIDDVDAVDDDLIEDDDISAAPALPGKRPAFQKGKLPGKKGAFPTKGKLPGKKGPGAALPPKGKPSKGKLTPAAPKGKGKKAAQAALAGAEATTKGGKSKLLILVPLLLLVVVGGTGAGLYFFTDILDDWVGKTKSNAMPPVAQDDGNEETDDDLPSDAAPGVGDGDTEDELPPAGMSDPDEDEVPPAGMTDPDEDEVPPAGMTDPDEDEVPPAGMTDPDEDEVPPAGMSDPDEDEVPPAGMSDPDEDELPPAGMSDPDEDELPPAGMSDPDEDELPPAGMSDPDEDELPPAGMSDPDEDELPPAGMSDPDEDELPPTGMTDPDEDELPPAGMSDPDEDELPPAGMSDPDEDELPPAGMTDPDEDELPPTGMTDPDEDELPPAGMTDPDEDELPPAGMTDPDEDELPPAGMTDPDEDELPPAGMTDPDEDELPPAGMTDPDEDVRIRDMDNPGSSSTGGEDDEPGYMQPSDDEEGGEDEPDEGEDTAKMLESPYATATEGDWLVFENKSGKDTSWRRYKIKKTSREEVTVGITDHYSNGDVKDHDDETHDPYDDVRDPAGDADETTKITVKGNSYEVYVLKSEMNGKTVKKYVLKDRNDMLMAYVSAYVIRVDVGDKTWTYKESGTRRDKWEAPIDKPADTDDPGDRDPDDNDSRMSSDRPEGYFKEDFNNEDLKYDWGWAGDGVKHYKAKGKNPGALGIKAYKGFFIDGKERDGTFSARIYRAASGEDVKKQVYEMYFRRTDADNYYKLQIRDDGKYRVGRRVEGKWEVLLGTNSGGYRNIPNWDKKNKVDEIKIIVRGTKFQFKYNDRQFDWTSDAALKSGGVGMYTGKGMAIEVETLAWKK